MSSDCKLQECYARFAVLDHMIAASTGAVLTSLLMTPLDVIKNRLQVQQTVHQTLSQTITHVLSEPLTPPNPSPRITLTSIVPEQAVPPQAAEAVPTEARAVLGKYLRDQELNLTHFEKVLRNNSFVRITAGVGDFWCPKCNLNPTLSPAMQYNGAVDALSKIFASEGAVGLWRGLAPALLMAVPNTAVYFTIYDYLNAAVRKWQTRPRVDADLAVFPSLLHSPTLPPLLAGTIARTATTTMISPLELLRTRAQAEGVARDADGAIKPPTMRHMLRAQWQQGGVRALFRGLTATLWRDVPFSAVYWVAMERVRAVCQRALGISALGTATSTVAATTTTAAAVTSASRGGAATSTPAATQAFPGSWLQEPERRWLSSFVAGASGGALAAVLTQPFDLIKTRRQVTLYEFPGSSFGDARGLSAFNTMRNIVAEEGLRGLFIGMGPRVFKVMPSCAIMISTYDAVKGWLTRRRREKSL